MVSYKIEVTGSAKKDLAFYFAFERQMILSSVRTQLTHHPTVETKKRKKLRDNPIASWELRVGKYRVFYEVDEVFRIVKVIAVGHEDHNILYIRGKEVQL